MFAVAEMTYVRTVQRSENGIKSKFSPFALDLYSDVLTFNLN